MKNTHDIIQDKIDEFVRKYYLNKLFRGLIVFIAFSIISYTIYAALEYFSYFGSAVRLFLLVSYLLFVSFNLVYYIIIPLLKMAGIGKVLTQEQVARIIGNHFFEIDDKLLNYMQLRELAVAGNAKSTDLLLAAIDNKIEQISPVPFIKAIPLHKTKKNIKWAVLPLLLFLLIFSIKSEIFTDSTHRIVHYSQRFEKPAPYSIVLEDTKLTGFQNDDIEVTIRIEGTETPKELFVSYQNKGYKCKKINNNTFTYLFKNLQKTFDFQCYTEETASKMYTMQVFPKPTTVSFVMELHYPAYLNKMNETIENTGDISLPEGTEILWKIYTKNTDSLQFFYQEKRVKMNKNNDLFTYSLRAMASFEYQLVNANRYFVSKDTMKYSVSVIQDKYPEIYVESQADSVYADRIYFKGVIKDDYGFNSLHFVYSLTTENAATNGQKKSIEIQIQPHNTIQEFYYYFDANTLNLAPGDKINYHFEVYDNDGVHGSKMSQSQEYDFKIKTLEEINAELNQSSSENKQQMKDLMKESDKLMKEIDKLNQQLVQTANPSWQDKKKLEGLMKQFEELRKQITELKQNRKEQDALENQFKSYNEEIIDKQKELERRMDDLLSDEMKQMMEQLQQLMNQGKKEDMQNAMEKMKSNTEEIQKQLDQQLEMYKNLEFEKKTTELIENLRQLSQEQQKLAEKTANKEQSKETLLKQQQQLEDKMSQLMEDKKELEKLNTELEEPNKLSDKSESEKNIKEQMSQSKESLNKNQNSKAADSQKKSAEMMEELSNEMEKEMYQNEADQIGEDMDVVRQILNNLIKISFRQEATMKSATTMTSRSAGITTVIKDQKLIVEGMKNIEDSLRNIAKRQPAVKQFVFKELLKITDALTNTNKALTDRILSTATKNQQQAFTSMNNLALMLSESMNEMKQQQKESQSKCNKPGSSSCNKPGGKNPKPGAAKTAKELQQQLNRQMEALKRSQQQGEKPKGQSPGQQPGKDPTSEQFAKMAAQQEAIRRMMQDYQNQLKSENGVGDQNLNKVIEDMKKTEAELVNKTLTDQTIKRQQDITTRLLESERAEIKKEQEKKRESTEARETINSNPPKEWKIDKQTESQTEMLRSVPAHLNYYYKDKVNHYFYNIDL
ncbi:MAG: hypothetical protein LBV46_00315 [Bacteroidales bacterium]|jgi:hypothetical protein|nr:hypothetical protein [Bacteroidales bacterium]